MKYALDASAGLKWVLVEPDADKARRLRDDFQSQIHELIAPDSFPPECAGSGPVARVALFDGHDARCYSEERENIQEAAWNPN